MANNYYVPKIQKDELCLFVQNRRKNGLKGFLKTYDD